MTRSRRPADRSDLFDLPLTPPEQGTEDAPPQEEDRSNLPLFPDSDAEESDPGRAPMPIGEDAALAPAPEERGDASVLQRLVGGLADLVVHGGVAAAALAGMRLMGLQLRLGQWPGILGFLLSFSFLYTVIPLAFWGQTPGMAWCKLVARDVGDRPLSFGQTALRWAGSVITVALTGLPLLLALTGRSLADRLSGSFTYRQSSVD